MEGPKDDLKWFGEGFDGFPKRLPEDCVEYMLFIIDSRLTQKEIITQLEAVRREASRLTNDLLKDYIWQRDEFKLKLKLEVDSKEGLKYLHGRTNYGDSVEDEWLIVYLLKELSVRFLNLWIKVVDTDGEFLLIEAANALPKWLNPEIADNRIWINDNKLRIIPLTASSISSSSTKTTPISKTLSQEEAHAVISTSPNILIHSPLIEAEAFYRIRNYPEQVAASLHYARITIPRKLAHLIHECPVSIAPAVESFYLRDPVALRPLQSNTSKLLLRPDDLVTTSVRLTKVLYAQLKSQQFSAPLAWKNVFTEAEKSKIIAIDRIETGMKLTSGYEMLLTDSKFADNRSVREINILLEDIEAGDSLPTDSEIALWKDSLREDSEEWLDINFEDFERELTGKSNGADSGAKEEPKPKKPAGAFGPDRATGFGDAKTQADLQKMVSRFESFLNDEAAGIDGAELDDMDYDDDDDDDDDDDQDEDSEDEDKEVSFDEKEFARMMREMMSMPSDETADKSDGMQRRTSAEEKSTRFEEVESDDGDLGSEDEGEEIRKVMARIEAELNEAGALDLDPTPKKLAALHQMSDKKQTSTSVKGKTIATVRSGDEDTSESEDEVDIDFNLAKNLLESFKSQAGMAGPGGNLLGMMGLQLPRDEGESEERIMPGETGRRMQ